VVAAGFDGGEPQPRVEVPSFPVRNEPVSRPSLPGDAFPEKAPELPAQISAPQTTTAPALNESSGFDDDEDGIDIPEFLK
jgi:cell division protein FtsZ